jgi:hypothetical protein
VPYTALALSALRTSPSSIAKCTFEQTHVFVPGNTFNADDVEAIVYIMEMIPASILASDTANLLLLAAMHSLFRPAALVSCPVLHLDERERLSIPSDEIHFAKALSIVAGNDLVAVLTEVAIGAEFPRRAFLFVAEVSLELPIREAMTVQSRAQARVKPVQQGHGIE